MIWLRTEMVKYPNIISYSLQRTWRFDIFPPSKDVGTTITLSQATDKWSLKPIGILGHNGLQKYSSIDFVNHFTSSWVIGLTDFISEACTNGCFKKWEKLNNAIKLTHFVRKGLWRGNWFCSMAVEALTKWPPFSIQLQGKVTILVCDRFKAVYCKLNGHIREFPLCFPYILHLLPVRKGLKREIRCTQSTHIFCWKYNISHSTYTRVRSCEQLLESTC